MQPGQHTITKVINQEFTPETVRVTDTRIGNVSTRTVRMTGHAPDGCLMLEAVWSTDPLEPGSGLMSEAPLWLRILISREAGGML